MTTRYAYINNNITRWGPGANPYFITLVNGDIWEISAHTVGASEAQGIFVVQQVNKRDFDERFEAATTPVYSIVNGRPIETWQYTFIPAARENMIKAVDDYAEARRIELATQHPGQYEEYNEVYREAVEVVALDPNATIPAGQYMYLEADIGVTYSPLVQRAVQTVREAADLVIATRDNWRYFGADIRKNRLNFKKLIRDAASDAEAFQIYNTISLPID
jgi:hypothetical protein